MIRTTKRQGQLIAKALTGAWRSKDLPEFALSESELDEVAPLLMGSGAAALGWRRISDSCLRESSSGELLHQAYRLQLLQSDIQEQKIEKAFRLLREASVEAILAKGWPWQDFIPAEHCVRMATSISACVPRTTDEWKSCLVNQTLPNARSIYIDTFQRLPTEVLMN